MKLDNDQQGNERICLPSTSPVSKSRSSLEIIIHLPPGPAAHTPTCSRQSRDSMFSRISQLARHVSRPLPNYAHRSAAAISGNMTSSLPVRSQQQSMIHTAACLIIGDEVLGGKVWISPSQCLPSFLRDADGMPDRRSTPTRPSWPSSAFR